MRFTLLCSRPAVSARTTPCPLEAARCTASNTTELGSPPSEPRTMSASGPRRPQRELLAGRGPEGVPGGEEDPGPRARHPVGHLPHRRGLAHPVHPDEQPDVDRAVPTVGPVGPLGPGGPLRTAVRLRAAGRSAGVVAGQGQRGVGGREHRHQVGLQGIDQGVGTGDLPAFDPRSQVGEERVGGAHPHVGPDERLLQVVPGGRIDLPLGPDRAQVAREQAPGLAQPAPERGRLDRRGDGLGNGRRLGWRGRLRLGWRGRRGSTSRVASALRASSMSVGTSLATSPAGTRSFTPFPRSRSPTATPPPTMSTGTAITRAMTTSDPEATTTAIRPRARRRARPREPRAPAEARTPHRPRCRTGAPAGSPPWRSRRGPWSRRRGRRPPPWSASGG